MHLVAPKISVPIVVIRDRLPIAAIDPDQAGQDRHKFTRSAILATQLFRPLADEFRPIIERSMMITGNLREAIEGAFAGGREVGGLRPSGVFAGLGVLFGTGAAVDAFMTKRTRTLTLGIPVVTLLVVLLPCAIERTTGRLP